MSETNVTVTRDEAIELFNQLGIKAAAKWTDKRMATKLAKVHEMVDDDTIIEGGADETLTNVLDAIENDIPIVIVNDEAPEEKPAKKAKGKAAKGKTKIKKPAEEIDEPEDDEPEAKPAKKAKSEKAKKAKAAKKAKVAKNDDEDTSDAIVPSVPGVRETRTRPYLAGLVVAKYGLEVGVTGDMIKELDDMYGKINPRESAFTLRNAWHAIRGYMEEK